MQRELFSKEYKGNPSFVNMILAFIILVVIAVIIYVLGETLGKVRFLS